MGLFCFPKVSLWFKRAMSQRTPMQQPCTCQIIHGLHCVPDLTVIKVFTDRLKSKEMDRSIGGKLDLFQAILFVIREF